MFKKLNQPYSIILFLVLFPLASIAQYSVQDFEKTTWVEADYLNPKFRGIEIMLSDSFQFKRTKTQLTFKRETLESMSWKLKKDTLCVYLVNIPAYTFNFKILDKNDSILVLKTSGISKSMSRKDTIYLYNKGYLLAKPLDFKKVIYRMRSYGQLGISEFKFNLNPHKQLHIYQYYKDLRFKARLVGDTSTPKRITVVQLDTILSDSLYGQLFRILEKFNRPANINNRSVRVSHAPTVSLQLFCGEYMYDYEYDSGLAQKALVRWMRNFNNRYGKISKQ